MKFRATLRTARAQTIVDDAGTLLATFNIAGALVKEGV